jgi:hypothetical protein
MCGVAIKYFEVILWMIFTCKIGMEVIVIMVIFKYLITVVNRIVNNDGLVFI